MLKVLFLLVGIHLIILCYVAQNRFSYSAVVDEGEDLSARYAYTLASGESLYGPDDVYIQRCSYTPLSSWFYSHAIRLFGLDIRFQRAVALGFGLGAIALLGACTWKMTGSRMWGFFASALFAGIDSGIWYMEISPQPVHVFFAMLGLFLLVMDPYLKWRTVLGVGLAFFACYWSKQTGLAYIAMGIFYTFIRDWRKGLGLLGLSTALIGGTALYCATRPDSDFVRLVFLWNALDPLIWARIWNPILFPEMAGRFGVLLAVLISALFMLKQDNWKEWLSPHLLFTLAGLAAGNFASMKYGSGNSQVIVGYAGLILTGLVFLHRWLNRNTVSAGLVAGLLTVQSFALIHPVSAALITDEDQVRFEQLVSIIRKTPGTVKFFAMGYYNLLAGKPAINDPVVDGVLRQREGVLRYRPFMQEYLAGMPIDLVIISVPFEYNNSLMIPILEKNYRVRDEMPALQRTGGMLRSRLLFLEKVKKQGV